MPLVRIHNKHETNQTPHWDIKRPPRKDVWKQQIHHEPNNSVIFFTRYRRTQPQKLTKNLEKTIFQSYKLKHRRIFELTSTTTTTTASSQFMRRPAGLAFHSSGPDSLTYHHYFARNHKFYSVPLFLLANERTLFLSRQKKKAYFPVLREKFPLPSQFYKHHQYGGGNIWAEEYEHWEYLLLLYLFLEIILQRHLWVKVKSSSLRCCYKTNLQRSYLKNSYTSSCYDYLIIMFHEACKP